MQTVSYEQQALECRKLASEMKDPVRKKQMEDMAEVWETLARQRHSKTNKSESASDKTA